MNISMYVLLFFFFPLSKLTTLIDIKIKFKKKNGLFIFLDVLHMYKYDN